MNKYQEVMDHIKVDDDMKQRLLQNVEKEMALQPRVLQFKATARRIRRYAGMAAMFGILLVGVTAVIKMNGGITNTSTAPMSDTAMEGIAEEAAEPAYESDAMTDSAEMAAQPAAEPAQTTGSSKAEDSVEPVAPVQPEMSESVNAPQEAVSASHYIAPILLAVIAFGMIIIIAIIIIWLIIHINRKR